MGVVFTLLLFLLILFFGLNMAEKNINQLAGIDDPPRSFRVELDQAENMVLTFAGNQMSFSLPAVKRACFDPGRLIHAIYLWETP